MADLRLAKSSSEQSVRGQQAIPHLFWVHAALPVQSCRPGLPRYIPRRDSAFFLPWLRLPCQTVDERHIRLHCSASLFDRLLFLAYLFPLVLWRLRAFSLPLLPILQETLHLGVQAVEKQIARFSIQALLKVMFVHRERLWTSPFHVLD